MSAVYVVLFLGSFVLLAFTSIFVVGSLVHLVNIGRQVLGAMTVRNTAQAEVVVVEVESRVTPKSVPAKSRVEATGPYAHA